VLLFCGANQGHAQSRGRPPTQAVACSASRSRRWVVSPDRIGPIPIAGLTIERVRQLCSDARDSLGTLDSHNIPSVVLVRFDGKVLFYPQVARPELSAVASGPVSSVVVEARSVRTAHGLGVGSSLGDVRARYGSVLIVYDELLGAEGMPRHPRGGLPRRIAFVLADFDAVTRAGGGWEGDTLRYSARVPSSIRVQAIEVWRPGLPPPQE